MESTESSHKKARMDDEKLPLDDIDPIKVVSLLNFTLFWLKFHEISFSGRFKKFSMFLIFNFSHLNGMDNFIISNSILRIMWQFCDMKSLRKLKLNKKDRKFSISKAKRVNIIFS